MTKKTIWALFDSEANSCWNALNSENCQVYSFGVGTGANHIPLKLSHFAKTLSQLEKYPPPDYLFAFPPCETWVPASASCKAKFTSEPGHNLHWKNKWTPFDFTSKYRENRLNGINTAIFVCELIKYYNPKFWIIENGNRSLIFDYMQEFSNLTGYKNKTTYFSYGFKIIKRTIILSNALLSLKKSLPKSKSEYLNCENLTGYKERSLVPAGLLKDIYNQLNFGGQKELFNFN